MSDDAYPTRFRKGQSGNPRGRPRKRKSPSDQRSPLQVIIDKPLQVDGPNGPRELSVEEALQQKALEDALAGKRRARRKVFNMLIEREKARAKARQKHQRRRKPISNQDLFLSEKDPRNADEVMRLLGIVIDDPRWAEIEATCGGPLEDERLLLDTWATQAALRRRRGGAPLSNDDIDTITRCTYQPETLVWPRSVSDVE